MKRTLLKIVDDRWASSQVLGEIFLSVIHLVVRWFRESTQIYGSPQNGCQSDRWLSAFFSSNFCTGLTFARFSRLPPVDSVPNGGRLRQTIIGSAICQRRRCCATTNTEKMMSYSVFGVFQRRINRRQILNTAEPKDPEKVTAGEIDVGTPQFVTSTANADQIPVKELAKHFF